MTDSSSLRSNSLMRRRIRQVLALEASAAALTFRDLTFPWSFYSDAIAALESSLAGHPRAVRIGIVLRNRPGPLAALIATIGTGREVVTLSPHLGDAGLARDIVDLAPDAIVAEDEDWARAAVCAAAETAGAIALRAGSDRALAARSGRVPRRFRPSWPRRSRTATRFPSSPITARPSSRARSPAGRSRTSDSGIGVSAAVSGAPATELKLRVIDAETGDPLPLRAVGLLEARGSQLPGDGAWQRTTDLAAVDEDGFLFIHGRADEAINRGGFVIPPSVIEEALLAHPAVDEASAVGLPDPRLGEVPAVAVTLASPATEQELMEYLASRLTSYQRPVAIKIVHQLPRTPSLKISRCLVREHFFSD